MTNQDDINNAIAEAQLALLTQIKERAHDVNYSGNVKNWAEAYAWLEAPAHSHGG